MTKKRLGLVLFGVVLVVVGLVAGAALQAPATAQETLRGHFRVQIDASGNLTCWRGDSGTACAKVVSPKESFAGAILTPIIVIKANPCYIFHAGDYYEVPC